MTGPSFADRLQTALSELARARNELARAAITAAEVKFELDVKEATFQAAGVEGGNEAQRKANLFLQCQEERAAALAAETGLKHAQRDFDVAEAAFSALKYELRAHELAVRSIELRSAARM